MRIIEDLWNSFKRKDLIPVHASSKVAFFAGVELFLEYLQGLPENTPKDTEERIIKAIQQEIFYFKRGGR
jgi:hypothetical protein